MNDDLFKALLPNQADLTLFTLVVSGEKNPLQQFCLQHAVREIPGAALPATPPKPAWDLTEGICGMKILQKPSGLSILGWIAALLLKHTANSYLIGSCCSYSHQVFSRDLLVTVILWFGQYLCFYWDAILFSAGLSLMSFHISLS